MKSDKCTLFGLLPIGYDAFPLKEKQYYEQFNLNNKYGNVRCYFLSDSLKSRFIYIRDGFLEEPKRGGTRGGRCLGFAVEYENIFFRKQEIESSSKILVHELSGIFDRRIRGNSSLLNLEDEIPRFAINSFKELKDIDTVRSGILDDTTKFIKNHFTAHPITDGSSAKIDLLSIDKSKEIKYDLVPDTEGKFHLTNDAGDQKNSDDGLKNEIVKINTQLKQFKKQVAIGAFLGTVFVLLLSAILTHLIWTDQITLSLSPSSSDLIHKTKITKGTIKDISYLKEKINNNTPQYYLNTKVFLEQDIIRSTYPNLENFLDQIIEVIYNDLESINFDMPTEGHILEKFKESNKSDLEILKSNSCEGNCDGELLKENLLRLDGRLLIMQI